MMLRRLQIILEAGPGGEAREVIRHDVAAPRKIISSDLLTASHLLNYSFVDSYPLCMCSILLKQFVFQLALEPERCLRWCFCFGVFDDSKQSGVCQTWGCVPGANTS